MDGSHSIMQVAKAKHRHAVDVRSKAIGNTKKETVRIGRARHVFFGAGFHQ